MGDSDTRYVVSSSKIAGLILHEWL